MKKFLALLFIVFCSIVFMGGQAFGVALSLEPSPQAIILGDPYMVDLLISGLGDGVAPSLGAFGVDILFDETILAISESSVIYGPYLGNTDPLAFETDINTTVGTGSVFLDELSFLIDLELNALQSDSFLLASLTFDSIGLGTTLLDFGLIDLADAAFPSNTITVDQTFSATATVAPIPEPATILLLASGMAGMGVFGRRRKTKK